MRDLGANADQNDLRAQQLGGLRVLNERVGHLRINNWHGSKIEQHGAGAILAHAFEHGANYLLGTPGIDRANKLNDWRAQVAHGADQYAPTLIRLAQLIHQLAALQHGCEVSRPDDQVIGTAFGQAQLGRQQRARRREVAPFLSVALERQQQGGGCVGCGLRGGQEFQRRETGCQVALAGLDATGGACKHYAVENERLPALRKRGLVAFVAFLNIAKLSPANERDLLMAMRRQVLPGRLNAAAIVGQHRRAVQRRDVHANGNGELALPKQSIRIAAVWHH